MSQFPAPIQQLIDEFAKLPGLGPKTAERIVFYLLEKSSAELENFGQLFKWLKQKITQCFICQNYTETNPCQICQNHQRNKAIICLVAKPQDVAALEKTGIFLGTYQVLGGTLNPLAGVKLENLKIAPLIDRLNSTKVTEIILALNPDLEGETTTLALIKIIKKNNPQIKITRLARGLPMGSDLEYADEVTLSNALKGRREV